MEHALVVRLGDLVVDLAQYRVLLGGQPLFLTYREYALLAYLATHAGRVVTKRRLLEEGLGRHDPGSLRMVDEQIRHLKVKIERGAAPMIEEVDGMGYRVVRPAEAAAQVG